MASPFARDTKTLDIPFDLPATVTIRQLSGRQIGKAQTAFLDDLIAGVVSRGGAKIRGGQPFLHHGAAGHRQHTHHCRRHRQRRERTRAVTAELGCDHRRHARKPD